jgi:hypothetical protein
VRGDRPISAKDVEQGELRAADDRLNRAAAEKQHQHVEEQVPEIDMRQGAGKRREKPSHQPETGVHSADSQRAESGGLHQLRVEADTPCDEPDESGRRSDGERHPGLPPILGRSQCRGRA